MHSFIKNYLHCIKNCIGPTDKKPKPRKSALIKKTQVLILIETPVKVKIGYLGVPMSGSGYLFCAWVHQLDVRCYQEWHLAGIAYSREII